jgi:branched-chain amino acid transport system permease protein
MAAWTIERGGRAYHLVMTMTALAVMALLIALPLLLDNVTQIGDMSQIAAYSVAILGLSLLTGYSGQISLGHSVFAGIGGYTTVILVARHGWPYLATIPVSIAVCLAAGAIVGIPALRIRGLYLAAVTLAIAAVFPTLIDKYSGLTGGANGLFAVSDMKAVNPFFVDPYLPTEQPIDRYYVIVAIAALMFLVARNIVRSRIGRALVAIRESPVSAAAAGIPVAHYKIFTFAVSAAFAGVAGSLLAIQLPEVSDSSFTLSLSIFLLVALIAGGSGTIAGAVPGALIFVTLNTYIADWATSVSFLSDRPAGGQVVGIASGALLLLFVFVLPGGAVAGLGRLRRRVLLIAEPEPPGWQDTAFTSGPSPDIAGQRIDAAAPSEPTPPSGANQERLSQ